MIMVIAIARSMANTISISMSMTTNLMLHDFVTFFCKDYHLWDDLIALEQWF